MERQRRGPHTRNTRLKELTVQRGRWEFLTEGGGGTYEGGRSV